MSDYRIAEGHDVALVSLNVMSPQPEGRPVRSTINPYGLSRASYSIAPYCEWVFSTIPNQAAYDAILAQMGLDSINKVDVTIYTRGPRLTYIRYNATVTLPAMGQDADWSQFFLRNVTFRFTNLEVAA